MGLRAATTDPNSPAGVLLADPEAAADLKATFSNLETTSENLDENMEAAQHAWPLRGGFKKKAKAEKKAAKEAEKAAAEERETAAP